MKRVNRYGSENGQSMVEFAFSLVILITLVVGIVDVGRALFTYMALRDAAQEGAQYASIHPEDLDDIKERVYNGSDLLRSIRADTDIEVTVIGVPCTGNGIKVQVSYENFPLTMPFLGAILGSQTIAISTSVTDTILRPGCP